MAYVVFTATLSSDLPEFQRYTKSVQNTFQSETSFRIGTDWEDVFHRSSTRSFVSHSQSMKYSWSLNWETFLINKVWSQQYHFLQLWLIYCLYIPDKKFRQSHSFDMDGIFRVWESWSSPAKLRFLKSWPEAVWYQQHFAFTAQFFFNFKIETPYFQPIHNS